VILDLKYDDVMVENFSALVIPGGKSPERVRIHSKAVEIVRAFIDAGKPVAAICQVPSF